MIGSCSEKKFPVPDGSGDIAHDGDGVAMMVTSLLF